MNVLVVFRQFSVQNKNIQILRKRITKHKTQEKIILTLQEYWSDLDVTCEIT